MEAGSIGKEDAGRTGARVLRLLAAPGSPQVLEELSHGPRRLSELRRSIGQLSHATLRARIEELSGLGIVARRGFALLPSAREYELTPLPGRELLFVLTTVEAWLASAPDEPIALASEPGRAAVEALVERWSSSTLRNTAHEVDDWVRKGMAPIAAATRWERRHLPEVTPPIEAIDVETGLLLALPLLRPAPELSGSCRLAVELGDGADRLLAGATVEVDGGRVTSCTTRLASNPDAWASGPPAAWLRTAIEGNPSRLELGGDQRLVGGLLDGLNQALFGPVRPLPPRG